MVEIPDLIGQVVSSMRKSGTFDGIIDNGDNTFNYLSVDHGLNQGEKVEMEGTLYTVIAVPSKDLFTTGEGLTPPQTFPGPWATLEPYYLYGHRRDINNRLVKKDKDKVFKYQKYPLIALRLPIPEDHSNDGIVSVSLNIAILAFTDRNYKSEERYENVIKPVLEPLYDQFLAALESTGIFTFEGEIPEHTKIDRLYWGIEQSEGNVRNIFTDPLDAIELIDLELNFVKNINC